MFIAYSSCLGNSFEQTWLISLDVASCGSFVIVGIILIGTACLLSVWGGSLLPQNKIDPEIFFKQFLKARENSC
jgi:hypothetical protein